MPKTRDAFALRELWQSFVTGENFMTGKEIFLTVNDFIGYFKELRKAQDFSQHFYAVDSAIEKISKYSLRKSLKGYDAAERIREQLRGNESLIQRIERHRGRLRTLLISFEVKNKSRLEELIRRYFEISDVIKSYHSELLKYQPTIIAQVSKEFSRDFGKRLRRARRFKDIAQDKISKDIALSQVAISGYERGTREPTLYTLSRLAKELGVSADYLLGLTNELLKN